MATSNFKISIHMVLSLDGFIAKKNNSVDWFETVDHYENGVEITEEDKMAFLKTIDCYVMGARTYEHALKLADTYGWAYGNTPTIVLTHKEMPVYSRQVEFFSGTLHELIEKKLKPRFGNIWVVGGALLAKAFISSKQANEIRVSILPVILGDGIRFIENMAQEQALHLKNVVPYKSGMVELCYEVKQ